HFSARLLAVRVGARIFASRYRFEDSKAPFIHRLSSHLRRSQNRGAGRDIDKFARRRALRRTADAARVNQDRIGPIEAETVIRTEVSEIRKDLRSLDEERSLFRKECFKCAEIDDRGIDFYLTEIRIDGRIENDIWTQ